MQKGIQMGHSPGFSGISGHGGDIAVLRHELANVINGLAGMAGLLKASGLAPEQQRWLDAIEDSAGQMQFLLQSSGCLATHAAEVEPGRISGLNLLEQAVTAHTPAASARGLRLLLVVPPDLPGRWRLNPRLLRQLLDNLLGNAIKFTDAGDVVLTARPAAGRSLCLSVADTGPGVPKADRIRIFGARERGMNANGRPGCGLGLSVCSEITGRLGGTIDCRPRGGGGAEFFVSLPGVLDESLPPGLPVAALEGIRCVLDFGGDLRRSVAGFLDRLGVPWGERVRRRGPRELVLRLEEAERVTGAPWPGLLLGPGQATASFPPQHVTPPVTHYALKQALLHQALAWRWSAFRPSDKPG